MKLLLLVIGLLICKRLLRTRPRPASLILMLVGLVIMGWSLRQGHYGEQFLNGPQVRGKVVDKRVEQDWTIDYIVTVSWRGSDGIERRHDLKTMADFFGSYEVDEPIELVLSEKSPELALEKSTLNYVHSLGPIFFSPAMYVGLFLLVTSALIFAYAFQIFDYYQSRSASSSLEFKKKDKKWRWDDDEEERRE